MMITGATPKSAIFYRSQGPNNKNWFRNWAAAPMAAQVPPAERRAGKVNYKPDSCPFFDFFGPCGCCN